MSIKIAIRIKAWGINDIWINYLPTYSNFFAYPTRPLLRKHLLLLLSNFVVVNEICWLVHLIIKEDVRGFFKDPYFKQIRAHQADVRDEAWQSVPQLLVPEEGVIVAVYEVAAHCFEVVLYHELFLAELELVFDCSLVLERRVLRIVAFVEVTIHLF